MVPALPRLSEYDVSPLNGFLPTESPCDNLSDLYYAPWESVVHKLQPLMLAKRFRSLIDNLPVLYTDYLADEAEWRRAYSILGLFVHSYIWGGETPIDVSLAHDAQTRDQSRYSFKDQ